jgi:hypothetical protein
MNSKPSFAGRGRRIYALMRDQLWWMTREWLRHDRNAMLPPDEKLIEELTTPTYSIASGKIKIMKKDDMKELLHRSPDRAEALILTFYNEFVESQESPDSLLAKVLLLSRTNHPLCRSTPTSTTRLHPAYWSGQMTGETSTRSRSRHRFRTAGNVRADVRLLLEHGIRGRCDFGHGTDGSIQLYTSSPGRYSTRSPASWISTPTTSIRGPLD